MKLVTPDLRDSHGFLQRELLRHLCSLASERPIFLGTINTRIAKDALAGFEQVVTGRRGEILKLQWPQVDLARRAFYPAMR